MFEQQLFEYVRDNFKVDNTSFPTFFGEASQNAKAPYIVQYRLDWGDTPLTQCGNDYTYYVQFNIYGANFSQLAYLSNKLIAFLADITELPDYTITKNIKHPSPIGDDYNTGLATATVTREFVYNT